MKKYRAQEELNHIFLYKIHNGWKNKGREYETDSRIVSYKRKGKKLKFYDSECKYSSRIKERSHKEK